jgi:hypothetical protein
MTDGAHEIRDRDVPHEPSAAPPIANDDHALIDPERGGQCPRTMRASAIVPHQEAAEVRRYAHNVDTPCSDPLRRSRAHL